MVRGYEILAQGRSSSTFQAIGLAGHLGMVFVALLGQTLWMSCFLIENRVALSIESRPSFDCSLRDAAMG